MSTPLNTPITLNITISTQEELLAFLLRANLDANNLRTWYHEHRNRPGVVVPDVRLTDIYKGLKAHMVEEGFAMELQEQVAAAEEPTGKTLEVGLN